MRGGIEEKEKLLQYVKAEAVLGETVVKVERCFRCFLCLICLVVLFLFV